MSITALAAAAASSTRLEKTASGEYTSGSVAVNQATAMRMGLERQADGNYAPPSWPLARSSIGVATALQAFQLGG